MTTYLAETARPSPLTFNQDETKAFVQVLAKRQERNRDCCKELFFAVFFDGTNNSRDRDRPTSSHSNVARLHDVFPLQNEAEGFFPIYAQGVGTEFKAIGDTGEGDDLVWGETDRKRGLAFAEKGEARMVWALLTMLNRLHSKFVGGELLSFDQIKKLSNELTEANVPLWAMAINPGLAAVAQWVKKRKLIDAKRNEVLAGLCRELEKKIQPFLKREPKDLGIRLSVFGFSRGSAQARVFSNWFVDMCHAASGGLSIGGLKVDFDFLGIFDTVASVGLANSTLIADGHMEWADPERSLRIPEAVTQCLHLVSAHELRRSFPLDSIVEASKTRREFVYPGVHSDLGGGYLPCEQGRGTNAKGDDLLSRVALAHMYRHARLANVPLDVNGQGVAASAKAALTVADSTRVAFNAYLDQCKVKEGTLAEIMDEQTRLYVRWRRMRLDLMDTLVSVQRALPQDRTDILEANKELIDEARILQTQLPSMNLPMIADTAVIFVKIMYKITGSIAKSGFDTQHYEEWQRLKSDWDKIGGLPVEVSDLFENYVHDSRAWFKPFGDDDDVWDKKQLKRMKSLEERQQAVDKERRIREEADQRRANDSAEQKRQVMTPTEEENRNPAYKRNRDMEREMQARDDSLIRPAQVTTGRDFRELSATEKRELDEWKKSGRLPTQPTGREPFSMGGGYLRYRRVYYASDARIVVMGARGVQSAAA